MLNQFLQHLWEDESGQDLVEYVLILALVTLVVVGALTALGTEVNDKFTETKDALSGAGG